DGGAGKASRRPSGDMEGTSRLFPEGVASGDFPMTRAARELSNPDLAPHVSFVELGGHGYAVVRAAPDALETEFVSIPAPLERSDRADGGRMSYQARAHARLWSKGEHPVVKMDVLEGGPK